MAEFMVGSSGRRVPWALTSDAQDPLWPSSKLRTCVTGVEWALLHRA